MAASDASPPRASATGRAVPGSVELGIGGQLNRSDIPLLCAHARELLEATDSDGLVCDVGAIVEPDAVTVDALARLQLTAGRLGRHLRLRDASPRLRDLLGFMGLADALALGDGPGVEGPGVEGPGVEAPGVQGPSAGGSGVEAGRQAEERKDRGGVEEEGDPADPTT